MFVRQRLLHLSQTLSFPMKSYQPRKGIFQPRLARGKLSVSNRQTRKLHDVTIRQTEVSCLLGAFDSTNPPLILFGWMRSCHTLPETDNTPHLENRSPKENSLIFQTRNFQVQVCEFESSAIHSAGFTVSTQVLTNSYFLRILAKPCSWVTYP